mgnify:FL=1
MVERAILEAPFKPMRYWMVHSPAGHPTKIMHETMADAAAEARRLAEKHPGDVFNVLEVVYAYWQPPRVECVDWRK